LALQDAISEEDNQTFLGRSVEVLVEGPSRAAERRGEDGDALQLTGRTMCDRIVVFPGTRQQIGQFLAVTILDCTAHTLIGEVLPQHTGAEFALVSGFDAARPRSARRAP